MSSAMMAAVLAQVAKITAVGVGPSPDFVPCAAVPVGLTLRHTYTTSQTPTKTGWPDWVYIVAVGGGGGGGNAASGNAGGGGGGACFQGWMKNAAISTVTIGAGGLGGGVNLNASGARGGATIIGKLYVPGGGGGNTSDGLQTEQLSQPHMPELPGAGWGGTRAGGNTLIPPPLTAFGIFHGGGSGGSGINSNVLQQRAQDATSGAGGIGGDQGGNGYQGPGGGGSSQCSTRAYGGNSVSPNGTTYLGGGAAFPSSSAYPGGAGILANAPNPGSQSGANVPGGDGGSGGGGGGRGNGSGGGGDGGGGAVLIYY